MLKYHREAYGTYLDDEEEWIIASHWISAWDAASPIGMILGSLFGGWFQDKTGRRLTLGLGTVTSVIGILIVWCSQYAAYGDTRNGIFMFGKVFLGLSCGMIVTSTQTYMVSSSLFDLPSLTSSSPKCCQPHSVAQFLHFSQYSSCWVS
jgi:MFS family permease